jgi:hypothetical protein
MESDDIQVMIDSLKFILTFLCGFLPTVLFLKKYGLKFKGFMNISEAMGRIEKENV